MKPQTIYNKECIQYTMTSQTKTIKKADTPTYQVYEWDFALHKGDIKLQTNNFEEAKTEALKIANSFCESETVYETKVTNGFIYTNDCDFGARIRKVN